MLVDEIWDFKSINMGRELEISGEFIYESAVNPHPWVLQNKRNRHFQAISIDLNLDI